MLSAEKEKPAEVIFTFDPDVAGQKAAMRAFSDSHKFNAQTFVAVGPEGLDPCDLRSQKGDEAVRLMIENKKPLFEFAIKQKIANFDLSTIEGRVGAARAAAPVIAGIRDAAMRPAYIRELAGWVNLEGNEVASIVDASGKQVRADAVAELRRDALPPEPDNSDQGQSFVAVNLNDPINRFERQILEVLVQIPSSFDDNQLVRIIRAGFTHPSHNSLLEAIANSLASRSEGDWLNVIASSTDPQLHGMLREIAAQTLPATDEEGLLRYGQGVISSALINVIAREKADLLAALRRIDAAASPDESAAVSRALMQLEAERRKLQS
jgi:DNA primase